LPHQAEIREIIPPSLLDSDSVMAVKLMTTEVHLQLGSSEGQFIACCLEVERGVASGPSDKEDGERAQKDRVNGHIRRGSGGASGMAAGEASYVAGCRLLA
jgi:hypothetical protein